MNEQEDKTEILDCGHPPTADHKDFTTGYGSDSEGKKYCYECCGNRDRVCMIETGNSKRLPLYLLDDSVANWCSTLKFRLVARVLNKHNWGLPRTDFWFNGPDGHIWHGFHVGRNTQIAHCKRTKTRWKKEESNEFVI